VNYGASISDFFKSPNWMKNLLLGGVCLLIPVVGQMVVLGWLITGFWARQDESFETFPDFDFSHFGRNLERGLWPFLVALVVGFAFSIVMVPLVWVLMIPAMLVGGFASSGTANNSGCFGFFAVMLMILFFAIAIFAMMLTLVPLKIRAALTQDFVKAFDPGFVRRFLVLTWKEIVISSLFVMITGAILSCLGAIIFCVGSYFALVLVYFSWTHLHKQLYKLYLSRGGEPVPLSPKLDAAPGV
jgi:hypothetical protein